MPREIAGKDPKTLEVKEFEALPMGEDAIRVKTEYAAPKHGTEIHAFLHEADAAPEYFDKEMMCFLPMSQEQIPAAPAVFRPGNMWVGRITEMGGRVEGYAVGDRVAGYGPLRDEHVITIKPEAVKIHYVLNNAVKMPKDMSWQAALCYDPCQFALSGIRDSQLRLGDTCCISGLGAIGLMAAQMARLQGAKTVIVSDPIAKRREIALAYGADYAIDPISEDAGLRMKQLTGGRGVDVVIETSGSYPALQAALRGVIYAGRIACVGWYGPDRGGFHLGKEAHMNNAAIFFSRACSEPNPDYPRWSWGRLNETCWYLLSSGRIRCEKVIDPIVPFEQAGEAYRKYVVEEPSLSVKMGVSY